MRLQAKQLLLIALLAISACAQSRRSLAGRQAELWAPMALCSNGNTEASGCFDVQLDVTNNQAYFDVRSLGFDALSVPYRVIARHPNSGWIMLDDNISATPGTYFTVNAPQGLYVEDMIEWRVELTQALQGLDLVPTAVGQGLLVVQSPLNWLELNDLNQ
jgi:hypothetical protein